MRMRDLSGAWWALWAMAAPAHAQGVPLEQTFSVLIEKAELERNARDRPWDPATGRLGNLRTALLEAPDCVVRIVSGAENRVFRGRQAVQVREDRSTPGAGQGPVQRNVRISVGGPPTLPRVGPETSEVCLTLQLATPHELILRGDGMAVLFDQVTLPLLRMYLNPSVSMQLWFHEIRVGALSVHANAKVRAGGTGRVDRLALASSQQHAALLFHDMDVNHVGVSTTTTHVRFSIRTTSDNTASYYQPARAPGDLANLYPIWIDGPVQALKVPVGSVNAMPLTDALREETRALRAAVLGRAGPRPALPAPDPSSTQPLSAAPISPRQRLSDALQPLLPPGTDIARVELWKNGAALEGHAPDQVRALEWVRRLKESGEVRSAQLAVARPEAGSGLVSYRILVELHCAAPGEASMCPPAPGGVYTAAQVQAAIQPLLGPAVKLGNLRLAEGGLVDVEGAGSEPDVRAALARIDAEVPWMKPSTSAIGNGTFRVRFRLACAVPPRATGGICSVEARGR